MFIYIVSTIALFFCFIMIYKILMDIILIIIKGDRINGGD